MTKDSPEKTAAPETQLRARASLIDALSASLDRGKNGLDSVPGLLRQILQDGMWRHFVTMREEEVCHEEFHEFLHTPPLKGLGASEDLVRRLIAHDPDVLEEFEANLQAKREPTLEHRNEWVQQAPHELSLPVQDSPSGTKKSVRASRAWAQLREHRPDVAARLESGEVTSLNAAMIEAGLRDKTVSIPVSKPDQAAVALRKSLSREDLTHLIQLLSTEP